MERVPSNIVMEQSRTHKQIQYNSIDPGNEQIHPASQAFMLNPVSSMNLSMRPSDGNLLEVKPVLNYSIQTGEEFALEFMRDRVNPRMPFIPNSASDPNYATGYMELKGILGISHTGSESGSDISMPTIVGKGPKDFERKNSSLHVERSNHGSIQSVPKTSLGYYTHQGVVHGYASSETSDSTAKKLKVLCSFGGKILPRPSDGKLRYVGGETRIILIRKNITWSELKQKILAIYNQGHVIKYQLPGEELDALVSVSCDEDLQNMMEECHELEDREGSQKLRIFLFSKSDLDDAQFSLGSMDVNSEIQYVVAVNGMDLGSRKVSTLHGFASSSAINVDELDREKIERDTPTVATDNIGVSMSPLTSTIVSSSTIQPTQPIPASSSNAYETYPQFYHGQMMHHGGTQQYPLQYGHDFSNYSPFQEIPSLMPYNEHVNQQGGQNGGQPYVGLPMHNAYVPLKEVSPKPDGSVQQEIVPERIRHVERDHLVASWPYDGEVIGQFPVEVAPAAVVAPEDNLPSLPSKNEGKHQEPGKVSSSIDIVNPVLASRSSDDHPNSTTSSAFGPGNANSESNPIDLSYLEPPVPPQRVYYSERIPREQAELLSRLSKSDDSLGSQFIISYSCSANAQQEQIHESSGKQENGNLASHNERPASTAMPSYTEMQTIDEGLAQLQKYKELADAIVEMNSKLCEDVLDGELAVLNPAKVENAGKKERVLNNPTENDKKLLVDDKGEAGSELPFVSQLASAMYHEDPASNLPELKGDGTTEKDPTSNNTPGQCDILIDIEERFPKDFLSEIFSNVVLYENSPGTSTLQNDGVGLSLNMENHEPKRWSYFQKLAEEDFGAKDVSLIDQDHIGFSSALRQVEEGERSYHFTPFTADGVPTGHVDTQLNFDEDSRKDFGILGAEAVVSESMQFDAMMQNLRVPDSDREDGKIQTRNIGLPLLDPSLGEFDIGTLQVIKNDDLEELRELGSGTFGTVYHGKWRGSDVAIKRIKKSCFSGRSSEQERLTTEFWREADILSKLHHPNVVAFYGVVQDGPGGTLATVAEFMVDGSLRHVLLRKDRYLDRRKRLIIAMDAAFGMEYLHSKNIVHFDLKCDNLLVNLKDPSRPICKVADFGLSKIKRNTLVSGGVRGTLPWMAPELLNGSSNKVSEKVDVFSFGIVLWEILTGEEPYANMHYGAIIGGIVNNTLRPTIPSYCDSEWRRLMEQCWAPNPATRPSFTEIASRLRIMSTVASQTKVHGHKASK
ncbi:PB1 domain-containing protein/Pkinase_Tyr domain-containing protein [Cephalotus follicularis]|uniref:PB1 domain-containing protein/Pkinase_Tyr domain-containing protein n=1 Tax=Cephalotus follicularis TaxID=3775 RepID=A0A1Q3C058_CEPFO|nr:PB1 domain-containing protein/Pkinase_Tyr domain-containing protein [Cephalotus follicularis]